MCNLMILFLVDSSSQQAEQNSFFLKSHKVFIEICSHAFIRGNAFWVSCNTSFFMFLTSRMFLFRDKCDGVREQNLLRRDTGDSELDLVVARLLLPESSLLMIRLLLSLVFSLSRSSGPVPDSESDFLSQFDSWTRIIAYYVWLVVVISWNTLQGVKVRR